MTCALTLAVLVLAAVSAPAATQTRLREVGQVGPDSSGLLVRASDSSYVEITGTEGFAIAQILISPDSLDMWRDSAQAIAGLPAPTSRRDEIRYDGSEGSSIFEGLYYHTSHIWMSRIAGGRHPATIVRIKSLDESTASVHLSAREFSQLMKLLADAARMSREMTTARVATAR